MRIRKRSMLPFSLSSPPRVGSDLFCHRGASVQKAAEAAGGDDEEAARERDGAVRGTGEGKKLREGGFDPRIDRGGARLLPSDRAQEEEEEAKGCCMLSGPIILGPAEVYRDAVAEEERCGGAREKGNSTGRNGSTKPCGAETSTDGRWEEREKVIPLKKRKGSLEEWGGGGGATTTAADQKQNKAKTKPKTKTKKPPTKKKAREGEVVEEEEEKKLGASTEAGGEEVMSTTSGKKGKRGNGSGLMEGSRCSRINGRGWRCCQQTLVGYSLCEHHLGKGRLRSMNSFPGRAVSAASRPSVNVNGGGGGTTSDHKSEAETASSCKSSTSSATKKKIGMVKARSISSLLGLSTAEILSTENSSAAAAASTSS